MRCAVLRLAAVVHRTRGLDIRKAWDGGAKLQKSGLVYSNAKEIRTRTMVFHIEPCRSSISRLHVLGDE
jgi:hypothetical protein